MYRTVTYILGQSEVKWVDVWVHAYGNNVGAAHNSHPNSVLIFMCLHAGPFKQTIVSNTTTIVTFVDDDDDSAHVI